MATTIKPRDLQHWILLRGVSREHAHWGKFTDLLKQRFPRCSFDCLDLPGCGDHFRRPSPSSVATIRAGLQRDWWALCAARNDGEAASIGIIGLSLGGMLALDWMAVDPRVAAAVTINSSAGEFPLHWRLRPQAVLSSLHALMRADIPARERIVLQLGSRCFAQDPHILAEWVAIQGQRPVSRTTVLRQLWAAAQFRLPANRNNTAGLVLCSRDDGMVSPRCSQHIARRYAWPLRQHDYAGHDLPLDDPQWVVDQLATWLLESDHSLLEAPDGGASAADTRTGETDGKSVDG